MFYPPLWDWTIDEKDDLRDPPTVQVWSTAWCVTVVKGGCSSLLLCCFIIAHIKQGRETHFVRFRSTTRLMYLQEAPEDNTPPPVSIRMDAYINLIIPCISRWAEDKITLANHWRLHQSFILPAGQMTFAKKSFLSRTIPAGNYMLKVNNRNTRTGCEIC